MQITITNGTLTQISETLSPSQGYALPSSVTVTGATSSYSDSTGVLTLTSPTSSMSVTAVAVQGDKISLGSSSISKIFVGNSEVAKIYLGSTLLYERTVAPSVDPVLANNSWETIKAVCEAGNASNYWSVGDTKTDTGTDSTTRTMRICDMQGLYGKHVVFEQVEQETTAYQWSSNNSNDYSASTIKTTMNSTIKGYYSSALQGALTTTTVKVAENGSSSTNLDVTDYLFLPAEKEIFGASYNARLSEADVLTQYQWYTAHNTANDHKKLRSGVAKYWWLRSPKAGNSNDVCGVSSSGNADFNPANGTYGLAPCFAF